MRKRYKEYCCYNWIAHMQKNEAEALAGYTQLNSKGTRDLNILIRAKL